MWIVTKLGFYSVVEVDKDKVQIRARIRRQLENLVDHVQTNLVNIPLRIIDTPNRDYAHRMTMTKTVWGLALASLGEGIDYDNFKTAAASTDPSLSWNFFLQDIWQSGYSLQAEHEKPKPTQWGDSPHV